MKGRRARSALRGSIGRRSVRWSHDALLRLGGVELLEPRELLAADVGAALLATPTLQIEVVFREDLGNVPGAEIASDSLRVGDTFFVEILAGDIRADAAGVTGLGLDISWPAGVLREMDFPFNPTLATSRLVTPNFPLFRGGTLSPANDMIDELRGAMLLGSGEGAVIGVNQLSRFSLLRFQADAVTTSLADFRVELGESRVAFADTSLDFVLDVEQQTFEVSREPGNVAFQISGTSLVSEGENASYTLEYVGDLLVGQSVSVLVNLSDSETTPDDYGDFAAALVAAGASQGVMVSGNRVTFVAGGPVSLNFSLPIAADDIAEGNEGFAIELSGAITTGGGMIEISLASALTTIAANGGVEFFVTGPASGIEGETLRYTIGYTGTLDADKEELPIVRVDPMLFNLTTQSSDHGDLFSAITAAANQIPGGAITFNNQTLAFRAGGPASLSFDLLLTDDEIAEGAEQFEIRLSNPRSDTGIPATLAVPVAATTIIDNESQLLRFDLEGPALVSEGQSSTYTIRRDRNLPVGQSASVAVALQDINSEPTDHADLAAALTLAASATTGVRFAGGRVIFDAGGSASLSFTITAVQDPIAEGTESYRIVLSSPLGSAGEEATIGNGTITTQIIDNDQIGFQITGSSQVNEGASASYTVSFTNQLEAEQSVTINVAVVDVTTTSTDYGSVSAALAAAAAATTGVTAQGSALTFAGGSATSLTFALPIVVDSLAESDEQFRMRISGVSTSGGALATIITAEAITTITNVAPAQVSFSLAGASQVTEGQSASYALSLAGSLGVGQSASVNLAITHGSTQSSDLENLAAALAAAAAAVNGVSASGTTVTFASGAPAIFNFTLTAVVDGLDEPTETFQIGLSDPVGAGGVLATITGGPVSTSILDNDEIRYTLTGTSTANEGSNATYTISYAGVLGPGTMVKILVSLTDVSTVAADHGSLAGALFAAASAEPTIDLQGTTLTFHAGGATSLSFTIPAFLDQIAEPNEAFRVAIAAAPDNAVAIVFDNASVQTTIPGVGTSGSARLDVRLVRSATPTDALGQAAALPDNSPFIDEWMPFFFEVWTSSQDAALGISSVDVDVAFENSFFVFDRLTPGPAFAANLNSTVDAENIRLFGTVATATRVGADQPLLVGRIRFLPASGGGVPLLLNEPAYITAVPNNNWAQIAAEGHAEVTLEGGDQPGTIDVERQPATDLYPVMYDIDNNGQIGFSDLAIFSASFLKDVDVDDPQTFKSDFDRSGRVGFSELSLFSANFLLDRNSNATLAYPSNFPSAFGSLASPPPPAEQPSSTESPAANALVWIPSSDDESTSQVTHAAGRPELRNEASTALTAEAVGAMSDEWFASATPVQSAQKAPRESDLADDNANDAEVEILLADDYFAKFGEQ